MKMTRIEAIKAKIFMRINECNDIKKLTDFNTILDFILTSSDEEKDLFRKLSKSKGFNYELFAQRLREAMEVSI